MFYVIPAIFLRIISNSYLNVFQKLLCKDGYKSSVINFFTYLGLSLLCVFILKPLHLTLEIIITSAIMGLLGALGNYFIIKALSCGELSTLAPINSYKPIVALIFGIFFLNEIPSLNSIFGIILIILGSYFIINQKGSVNKKALFYRFLALIFSGLEAIFIKKIILLTSVQASFCLWAFSGLIFSFLFLLPNIKQIKLPHSKYQAMLILCVFLMQYSTNYVFSKINVSYALALFQLSVLLSVFLGVNMFDEKNLKRKILASCAMIVGAIIIILS